MPTKHGAKGKATQPTGQAVPANFNAKDFIMESSPPPSAQPEPASWPERLKSEHVFFYPACRFDWYPLYRFSDQCRLFVYCDWYNVPGETRVIEEFEAAIRNIHDLTPAGGALRCGVIDELQPEQLGICSVNALASFLTAEELRAYKRCWEMVGSPEGWGRQVKLTRSADGAQRHLILIYLCAEGVATYLNWFMDQETAPRYLCIKRCGHGFGCNYTNYNDLAAPLGRAVRANLRRHGVAPEYFITDCGHDWPWNVRVERFQDWPDRPTLYRRPRADPFRPKLRKGTKASVTRVTHWPVKLPTDKPNTGGTASQSACHVNS